MEVLDDKRDHVKVTLVGKLIGEKGLELLMMAFAERLEEEAGLEVLVDDEFKGRGSFG